eukprot:72082-Pleurochrysis_carterae.AAC.2
MAVATAGASVHSEPAGCEAERGSAARRSRRSRCHSRRPSTHCRRRRRRSRRQTTICSPPSRRCCLEVVAVAAARGGPSRICRRIRRQEPRQRGCAGACRSPAAHEDGGAVGQRERRVGGRQRAEKLRALRRGGHAVARHEGVDEDAVAVLRKQRRVEADGRAVRDEDVRPCEAAQPTRAREGIKSPQETSSLTSTCTRERGTSGDNSYRLLHTPVPACALVPHSGAAHPPTLRRRCTCGTASEALGARPRRSDRWQQGRSGAVGAWAYLGERGLAGGAWWCAERGCTRGCM